MYRTIASRFQLDAGRKRGSPHADDASFGGGFNDIGRLDSRDFVLGPLACEEIREPDFIVWLRLRLIVFR